MKPATAISHIMTTSPITLRKEDSLKSVEDIFNRYPFHHLPVVDQGNIVVGIISKVDVLNFLKNLSVETTGKYYSKMTIRNSTVDEIMTKQPIVLDSDDTIGLAADIFLANKFHAIPVVENNQLVGIITSHDLLSYAYKGNILENFDQS